MMSRNDMSLSLFRILYQGAKILYKSLYKSVVEEIELSREAARIRYQEAKEKQLASTQDMTLTEAMQILNVDKLEPEKVEKRFKLLFESNEKSNGGSLYLQSKIIRAKQRLDEELKKLASCPKCKLTDSK